MEYVPMSATRLRLRMEKITAATKNNNPMIR